MDFTKLKNLTIPKGSVKSLSINGVKVWSVESSGLYDANNTLLASWDSLVNTYKMNCSKDYTTSYANDSSHPYNVLSKNNSLVDGTKLVIGDGVTVIGQRAFYNCSKLTNIEIPNSVTTIKGYAFYACTSLTSIIIPDSVTSLGMYAFYGCYALTSVKIGNGIESIGSNTFYNCGELKRVDFSTRTSIPTLTTNSAFMGTNEKLQIKVPANLIDSWKSATNWSKYADKLVTEFTNEV